METVDDFDLMVPEHAYMFGFIQADGHLEGSPEGKGKLKVELSVRDRPLLEIFQEMVPSYSSISERTRTTNFMKEHRSVLWTVYDRRFRSQVSTLGVPYGPKSRTIAPPHTPVSLRDYFRGLMDADGSLGLTKVGWPFVSLCTSSPSLANAYTDFLRTTIGVVKRSSPNTRDGAFNIACFREHAQDLACVLYYPGALALSRKMARASQLMKWKRPPGMRRSPNRKRWAPSEDRFIATHSLPESMEALGRSASSIKVRRWRLVTA